MLLLEAAALALGVHIIGDRRAFQPDRGGENVHHGGVQTRSAFLAHAGGDCAGMNARFEQRFVGIDVAHAAQKSLVQQ
jgi:hypothetical protein